MDAAGYVKEGLDSAIEFEGEKNVEGMDVVEVAGYIEKVVDSNVDGEKSVESMVVWMKWKQLEMLRRG